MVECWVGNWWTGDWWIGVLVNGELVRTGDMVNRWTGEESGELGRWVRWVGKDRGLSELVEAGCKCYWMQFSFFYFLELDRKFLFCCNHLFCRRFVYFVGCTRLPCGVHISGFFSVFRALKGDQFRAFETLRLLIAQKLLASKGLAKAVHIKSIN